MITLGAGIIIGAILMNLSYNIRVNISIEDKARKMGMIYPEEVRVLNPKTEE